MALVKLLSGERVSTRSVNIAAGRREGSSQLRNLSFRQKPGEGRAHQAESKAANCDRRTFKDIEADRMNVVRKFGVSSGAGKIVYRTQELDRKLHRCGRLEQEAMIVRLFVCSENGNLPVMPGNAGHSSVCKCCDQCNFLRGESELATIAEGGAVTNPVLNSRDRTAGGR